jgi:hypothetical protein
VVTLDVPGHDLTAPYPLATTSRMAWSSPSSETYPERVTQLLDSVIESCTQKLSRNMKSISRGLGSPNRALVRPLTVPTVAGALILLAGKVKFG